MVLDQYARRCADLDGQFWECGVLDGDSASIIAPHAKELLLFDSFEGLPRQTLDDLNPNPAIRGMFRGNEKLVRERFPFAYVYPGWIPGTFKGLENARIAFAHVDLDLYAGTKYALEFIVPRMIAGGAIVVDDYSETEWFGVKRAVDEFHLKPIVEVPHQCVLLF
jgi:O-methyltransferase